MYRTGDRFGEYEIARPLRSGGMAMVFLARRTGSGGFVRYVAIKLLRPELAAVGYVPALFAREARLLSQIDHPNVVRVEAFGEESGAQYLVMEYVHGVSLAQLLVALRDGGEALAVREAVAIAIAIADGLHAAHEARSADGALAGIVHRDVSPQNVLVASTGHVKLIDFGVARGRVDALAQATVPGPIGKARYMSPEQSAGQEIDRRADVYALGVVLLEMLLGEDAPLDGVARAAPNALGSLRGDRAVLDAIADVLARALAPAAGDRLPSARSFRDALLAACPEASRVGATELAALIAEHAVLEPDPRVSASARASDERSRSPEAAAVLDATLAPEPMRSVPDAKHESVAVGPERRFDPRLVVLAVAMTALVYVVATSSFGNAAHDPAPIATQVDEDAATIDAGPAITIEPVLAAPTALDAWIEQPDAGSPHPRVHRPGRDVLPLHDDPGF